MGIEANSGAANRFSVGVRGEEGGEEGGEGEPTRIYIKFKCMRPKFGRIILIGI